MELSMTGRFLIWSLFLLFGTEFVQCEYNFTYAMASRCKEHISPGEYKYTTFYRVNANDRKFEPGMAFEMHFAILASSNGHLMLSPVERPSSTDSVYEIVIGAGGNTFSEVRKMQGKRPVISASTKGILSPIAFRAFWIKLSEDGLIEFGKEGAQLATLSYQDVDPLTVRFFSFATWSGVQAKFLYDCPFGQNETDPTGNSTLVEEKLTNRQELRNNIMSRGRGRPDENITTVYVTATVAGLRFDSENCFLEATITLIMSWADKAISWQPKIYNGTDHLSVRNNEIWTPELVLYNSVGHGVIEPDESERVQVTSEGVATLSLRTRQQVTCVFNEEAKYRWPRDEYECNFLIGPWSMQDHLVLDLLTNSTAAKYFSFAGTPTLSVEWDVTTLTRSIVTYRERHGPRHDVSNTTSDEDQNTFKIHVTIKRKSYSYYLFLTIPFIVIVMMILLSFILNPLSQYRIWFYCGMILIISLFIMYLDSTVPSYTMPLILIFYTVTMFMLTAVLLLYVVLEQPYCKCIFNSRMMQAIIMNKFLRTVVGLPSLKTCERYDNLNDGRRTLVDSMSMETEPGNTEMEDNSKEEAIIIIDRFVFGIYLVVYVTMTFTAY